MKTYPLTLMLLMIFSCGELRSPHDPYAFIDEGPKNTTVRHGKSVSLECVFQIYNGPLKLKVMWLKAIHSTTQPIAETWRDSGTYEINSEEFHIVKEVADESELTKLQTNNKWDERYVSKLEIKSAEKAHAGKYLCHKSNEDYRSVYLDVIPIPGKYQ